MDYTNKKRNELVILCKEKNIKGYSTKTKDELLKLLESTIAQVPPTTHKKIYRLNYIGSKFQLLDWLTTVIKEKTDWTSFANKRIGDLFAGTGIVSYHFRESKAIVFSNDAELYSSIITHAFTRSIYTLKCKDTLELLQTELDEKKHLTVAGFVTTHYSPHNSSERKFFTVENAKAIDYTRGRIESMKDSLSDDEYKFILASLLISADAVSNVPAVYGCFLKNFKDKAKKNLKLNPIHTIQDASSSDSKTTNFNVLSTEFPETDLVYLDPPYNERQYSKNYFPLNIIAKTPHQLQSEDDLRGKTGIPSDCFISPFCKRGKPVEDAFNALFKDLKTKWIFMSYNSESIVSKDKILELMGKYGTASVVEKEYKRFKSFEYNKDVDIKEYLFCLKKS